MIKNILKIILVSVCIFCTTAFGPIDLLIHREKSKKENLERDREIITKYAHDDLYYHMPEGEFLNLYTKTERWLDVERPYIIREYGRKRKTYDIGKDKYVIFKVVFEGGQLEKLLTFDIGFGSAGWKEEALQLNKRITLRTDNSLDSEEFFEKVNFFILKMNFKKSNFYNSFYSDSKIIAQLYTDEINNSNELAIRIIKETEYIVLYIIHSAWIDKHNRVHSELIRNKISWFKTASQKISNILIKELGCKLIEEEKRRQ